MSTPILASTSSTRAALLARAGVEVEAVAPRVDEDAARASLSAEGLGARDMADALAELKALKVGARMPERTVIGCDQTLECDGMLLPSTPDARARLRALQGRQHRLHTACVVVRQGRPVWRHVGTARLWMRPLDDAAIEAHLARVGDLGATSGGYRLEDAGVRLFARIHGDHFHILGLPLIELLNHLATSGDIA
ncbi:MAG: Maf family protein [Paracoccaceae bacterium]